MRLAQLQALIAGTKIRGCAAVLASRARCNAAHMPP
jgi:hypothetical protein